MEQLPKSSMLETDAAAKEGLRNYRDLVDSDISVLTSTIAEAQLYRPGTLDKTRRRLMQAYNLKSLLNALYENYDKGASGSDIPTNINTSTDVDEFLLETPALKPIRDMSIYYTKQTGG